MWRNAFSHIDNMNFGRINEAGFGVQTRIQVKLRCRYKDNSMFILYWYSQMVKLIHWSNHVDEWLWEPLRLTCTSLSIPSALSSSASSLSSVPLRKETSCSSSAFSSFRASGVLGGPSTSSSVQGTHCLLTRRRNIALARQHKGKRKQLFQRAWGGTSAYSCGEARGACKGVPRPSKDKESDSGRGWNWDSPKSILVRPERELQLSIEAIVLWDCWISQRTFEPKILR